TVPVTALSGKEVWLLSGIANPKQFEQQLLPLGLRILGHSKYPDHYPYTSRDMEKLLISVQRLGAELLLTTEKDFVRIPDEFKKAFVYPVMEIKFLDNTAAEFTGSLASRLQYIK
ncbi:MAG: tetraacyldisaccharide 4'-kinase, partial [Deferribacteraceae bacterium]|nr:tetraacyldisaccharide 4'-kinase [Deferribacteraceae bacterium]